MCLFELKQNISVNIQLSDCRDLYENTIVAKTVSGWRFARETEKQRNEKDNGGADGKRKKTRLVAGELWERR